MILWNDSPSFANLFPRAKWLFLTLKIQNKNGATGIIIFNKSVVYRSFHESTIHRVIVLGQIMLIDLSRPRNTIVSNAHEERGNNSEVSAQFQT